MSWDAVSRIYFNPTQEDANNPFLEQAALALQEYLQQMSGRTFTIVNVLPDAPAIYLDVDPSILSPYGEESFRLRVNDDGVTIIGASAIAVRWGAFYLLDEKLGLRKFFKHPAWTVVPSGLAPLNDTDEIHQPHFRWRFISTPTHYGPEEYGLWCQYNRVPGAKGYTIMHSYGHILNHAMGWHSWSQAEKEAYWAGHQDEFLPTGEPPVYPWQLNPENAHVEEMAKAYAESRSSGTWGFQGSSDALPVGAVPGGPNDGGGWNPPYTTYQEVTDAVFGLVSRVAASLPQTLVGAYSYADYCVIPQPALAPNVLAVVASTYNYSNLSNRTRVQGLQAKGIQVGWRDYTNVWAWWGEAANTGWDLLETIRWLHNLGVAYYQSEGIDAWGSRGLTYYLSAKLLWDANQNLGDLVADFYIKAFGPAALPMAEFFESRAKDNVSMAHGYEDLIAAEVAAAGNPAILERIYQMSYWQRFMWKYHNVGRTILTAQELEEFYTFVCKTRDTYILDYRDTEIALRAELINNRGYTATQVNALQDFTPPTAEQATECLAEGLAAFDAYRDQPEFVNLTHTYLKALGNTTAPIISPLHGSVLDVIVPSAGNESVRALIKVDNAAFIYWYGPNGAVLGTLSVSSPIDWTAHDFPTYEAGNYVLHVSWPESAGVQVDVPGRPASAVADERKSLMRFEAGRIHHNAPRCSGAEQTQYFHVPAGIPVFEFRSEVPRDWANITGALTEPDGITEHPFELIATYADEVKVVTIENPAAGLWKLRLDPYPMLHYFWFRGIAPLVWHNAEDLLIPTDIPPAAPPVLNLIGDRIVREGHLLTFTILAVDPNGDPLTYSASNLPLGASFSPNTQTFSWIPSSNQAGDYPDVHFEVSDGTLTDSEDITIAVTSGNNPPVLNPIGDRSVRESQLLAFIISATDSDNDLLTYSMSNLPAGVSFNPNTQTFSWTPTSAQVGVYPNVHFEVSDGELTDAEDITITVTANHPPVLSVISDKIVEEGQLLQFSILASDPDSDPLTYSASNLPSGANFDAGTQVFTWIPAVGQAGAYSNVHFEVSDGELTDAEDITITVVTPSPTPPPTDIVSIMTTTLIVAAVTSFMMNIMKGGEL